MTSATQLLEQARAAAGAPDAIALDIDEPLRVRVAALTGDLDAASNLGEQLLAATDDPTRRGRIHRRLAEAASTTTRWGSGEDHLAVAARLTSDLAEIARIDALSAQVMLSVDQAGRSSATKTAGLGRRPSGSAWPRPPVRPWSCSGGLRGAAIPARPRRCSPSRCTSPPDTG